MATILKYRVETVRKFPSDVCTARSWWTPIAAFDCERAAMNYARECWESNWQFANYRVVGSRNKVLRIEDGKIETAGEGKP